MALGCTAQRGPCAYPFISMPDPTNPGQWIPVLSFHAAHGKLFADVRLFSPVTGEAFVLKQDGFSRFAPAWDMNFNDSALEVVNEAGVSIFQLIRKAKNILQLYGFFRVPNNLLFLGIGRDAVSAALSQQVMQMTKTISESVEKVRASADRPTTF